MFGAEKYRAWLRHPGCNKKDTEAPDYTPMAEASAESAKIMGDLGQQQLDFSKLQYEESKPIIDSIIANEQAIQDNATAQGNDYYNYMVENQRPVEEALNAEAMAAGSQEQQDIAAGKAAADVRQGTTQQQNQLIRQGLRYGLSPSKIAAMSGSAAAQSGLAEASAMNNAREQEKALGYAKKLDVAGLYRGLPAASQGAYGVALNAGNSASANSQVAGSSYVNGMSQGASTIASGQSLYQQGLGSIMGSQGSISMANQNSSNEAVGAGVGAVAGIAVAVI